MILQNLSHDTTVCKDPLFLILGMILSPYLESISKHDPTTDLSDCLELMDQPLLLSRDHLFSFLPGVL